MTNYQLRNFAENILNWDQRKAIRKKINSERYDRVCHKLEQPVWNQIRIPICEAIRKSTND